MMLIFIHVFLLCLGVFCSIELGADHETQREQDISSVSPISIHSSPHATVNESPCGFLWECVYRTE